MYGLTREQAYPGCHLRDLLEIRKASGTFFQDIDEYVVGAERRVVEGKVFNNIGRGARPHHLDRQPADRRAAAGSRPTRTLPSCGGTIRSAT